MGSDKLWEAKVYFFMRKGDFVVGASLLRLFLNKDFNTTDMSIQKKRFQSPSLLQDRSNAPHMCDTMYYAPSNSCAQSFC